MTSTSFTTFGIIAGSVFLWVTSVSASGDVRHLINLFLLVLLVSMVLLNWAKIGPLFFKQGG